jgi:hypothetical protein
MYTREYSLTVGDHPCSSDSVGLTLDWKHAPEYAVPVEQADWTAPTMPVTLGEQGQQQSSSSNNNDDSNNNNPRRRIRLLSATERRKRICSVTGCLPSDVRVGEYNMALQRYNQELAVITNNNNRNRSAQDNATDADTLNANAAYDRRHLLEHQQHLEALYSLFQQQQQHQHKRQQQHQQQQQYQQQRQPRSSKRAAPESAHGAALRIDTTRYDMA